uniref:Uncharacterized protein n=1 Tax=Candidatus Kentrum sp. LPFa TaxID=2126335 RepID=A0A450XET3_9GAMM|nr:MAG: hypothetical protein BECKLPF1236A_GA0070988_1000614 [Candidatus Kentron sp. LPFa]VFK27768.1 MAG: hypothetical protein BECKLPF1236C_GA0070990_100521 [Candidatus Kentron sp. LPFa]
MALDPGFHAGMTGSLNLGLISKSKHKDTRYHAFVGLRRKPRQGFSYPPKSSSMMFSRSIPKSSNMVMTAEFIMGGPHI